MVGSPTLFSVWCRPTVIRWREGTVSSVGAHRVALLHSTANNRENASTGVCCDHFEVAIHMNGLSRGSERPCYMGVATTVPLVLYPDLWLEGELFV